MPSKKKKKSKLIPGQTLLGIKTPRKSRKVTAAHHPSFQGLSLSGDRGQGGIIYEIWLPNGTKITVETTVTISDGVHRVAKLTSTPVDAVDAKALGKIKRDLNRTHRSEGRYDDGKIAKLFSDALKKLATPEERQVMDDDAQDVYNQRSAEKKRKEKQAELDARLKEEKERTEKRRKQNMALLAKTHAQRGSDWRAAERRILPDEYFPEISQAPLTPHEEEFLAAAIKNPLTRIPLQPWVVERVGGTLEGRMRHRFQTSWGVHWEQAEGPLQGAFSDRQRLWLIRNHENSLHAHAQRLHSFAGQVRTCLVCNRRQVVIPPNQQCASCVQGTMFQAENLMSLGPPLAAEASLGIQYQRADLFNTMAKATDMEKNLIRAVAPVIRISRLVYSGTGQFSFRGHSIGFANGAMDVAWNLPRTVDTCGTQLICDPGENYKNDPEMARLMHARRALVHHLLCLALVTASPQDR